MSHRADAVLARAVPEGIKVKTFVADLKESFEGLPKKSYACEMTRTNKGICYSPVPINESVYWAPLGDYFTAEYSFIWLQVQRSYLALQAFVIFVGVS